MQGKLVVALGRNAAHGGARRASAFAAAALLAAACGKGSTGSSIQVSVSAASLATLTREKVQLAATVTGATDPTVAWTATAGGVDASGLFTAPAAPGPVTVTATSVACQECSASVTLSVFEIPVLTVNTDEAAPIDSKEDYVSGVVSLDPQDGTTGTFGPVAMKIRGRGNTSWERLDKKPYKLKLDDEAGLLGMPADKEWALLANHSDRTLLRNAVTLELGRRLGMDWVPRSRFVELMLNGSYNGTYMLIETVKVAPSRVNVTKLKDTDVDEPAVTGGYLLEVDWRATYPSADPEDKENLILVGQTESTHPFVLKEPGNKVNAQFDWIAAHLRKAQDAIFASSFQDASTGYQAYWDIQSLVDWYLVEELVKNVDGNFYSSVFVHKERGGLLHIGPLWDFDLAMGNVTWDPACVGPEGWYIRTQGMITQTGPSYYERLFQDPAFVERVRARWHEVKANQIDTIFDYIDETAAALDHAQAKNFTTWPILGVNDVWPNAGTYGDYDGEVDHLKQWLRARIDWIDANIDL